MGCIAENDYEAVDRLRFGILTQAVEDFKQSYLFMDSLFKGNIPEYETNALNSRDFTDETISKIAEYYSLLRYFDSDDFIELAMGEIDGKTLVENAKIRAEKDRMIQSYNQEIKEYEEKIKELKEKIKELKEKIKELKEKIKELEEKIKELR